MKKKYNNPLVVAVTGGIGSGQTTVSKLFGKWGAKVINADLKAKEIMQKDREIRKALKQTFGNNVFFRNGKLNTRLLAELAFKDELHTQKLNQIVHPRMVSYIVEEMEEARFSKRYPMVVIDAALVYEINIEQLFDAIVVVYAPIDERYRRVRQRDGMSKQEFFSRVDRQIPLEEKRKWADFVIDNSGSFEELEREARQVFEKLLRLQQKKEKQGVAVS